MKKLFLIVICFIVVLLSSCGLGDWEFYLPNGYEIWRINSNSICLEVSEVYEKDGEKIEKTTTVLDGYIRRFCYGERYVGIQFYDYLYQTEEHEEKFYHNPEHAKIPIDNDKDIGKQFDKFTPDFYIVDTESGELFGPLTELEYYEKLEEIGITDMCEWIPTSPTPKDAHSGYDELEEMHR